MRAITRAIKLARRFSPHCLLVMLFAVGIGCRQTPSIAFLQVPPASLGGGSITALIRGHVNGPHSGAHIVLYTFADGRWWVQPFASSPVTEILADGSWKAQIHLGTKYAALLTKDDKLPPQFLETLPSAGGSVDAVEVVKPSGDQLSTSHTAPPSKTLRFSGFDWQVRTIPGDYGAKTNEYSAANVSLDESGALHMRLTRNAGGWVCSEIHSVRSLGYGDYRLQVQDVSSLEPAVMFSTFSLLAQPTDGDHREMDIHITRRGEPANRNAEFVVQPSFVPANFYYFNVPPGPLAIQLKWTPEKAEFSAVRLQMHGEKPVASWIFDTGVPRADEAQIYINFCNFGNARIPPTHNAEVVVKSFDFFP